MQECPTVDAWRQVHRLHLGLSRWLERNLAPAGVTPPQLLALVLLREGAGSMTPTRLARELGHDTRSVTGLLDRLERQGWVRRVLDSTDRRSFRLELTEAGGATLEQALPLGITATAAAFAAVDPEAVGSLRATLAKIEAATSPSRTLRRPEADRADRS
jgi:DNA-binding MarR family transcriptional regulator